MAILKCRVVQRRVRSQKENVGTYRKGKVNVVGACYLGSWRALANQQVPRASRDCVSAPCVKRAVARPARSH
ncbi:hypothetical protein C2845_PM01G42780 [Panicum miliaceum]|uniref:Uncharacterized protein n=1 Tax=Panicum miliaceum TaxID=4540 RepID=A0A3L6TFE1_PANMI|nr:hypothetical protein C2845_PM01G42780 [Panicum miliaceum]